MLKKTLQIIVPLAVIGLVLGLLSRQRPRLVEPSERRSTITRVVSIHPAATEIIYALGRSDRLVGVSDYSTYPPEARSKSRVGSALAPDLERLRKLAPQLVLVSGENKTITDFCRQEGLAVRNLHMESIAQILDGIQTLGRWLNAREAAVALCRHIQTQINTVKTRAAGQPPVSVFFSLYRTSGSLAGLTTVGPHTYLNELITLAGGHNIFNDVHASYPLISKEALVKRQPQVIIEPRPVSTLNADAERQWRRDWAVLDIPAVRNHRIYFPDADRLLKPGPRVGLAALELVDLLHPGDGGSTKERR